MQAGGDPAEPGLGVDITYIPTARGVVYPAAAADWLSRQVLAWRLSIPRDAEVWPELVAEAGTSLGRYLDVCNSRRPHSGLGAWTPEQAHFDPMSQRVAARKYDRCLRPASMRLSILCAGAETSK